jgi:hypothetical protein
MKSKFYLFILAVLSIGVGLACGSGDQQTEANNLVSTANKLLAETNLLIKKTESRNQALFDADIQTDSELEAYKIKMKDEASEIVQAYKKSSEMLKDISNEYDSASRMNVQKLYQDYAKLKSAEFAKRSEAFDVRKGNAQAFIEIDSPKIMTGKFDENNSNFEKLIKEANEFGDKAKKFEDENKDFFKEIK